MFGLGNPPRRVGVWALGLGLGLLPLAVAVFGMAGCRRPAPAPAAPAVTAARAGIAKLPVSEAELADFAGTQACLSCHRGLAGQTATHHYHTMSPASDPVHRKAFARGGTVTDSTRGLTYRPALGPRGPEIVAVQGKGEERALAKWAFGSGNRAFTYVGDFDGAAVELRLSYFRQVGRWDFTPGQQPKYPVSTPVGNEVSAADVTACVNCHTTAAVVKNGVVDPEKSTLGIGCEGCHGAGRPHIRAVQAGERDLRMARLAADRHRTTLELCGSCHRTEATGGDPHSPDTQGQLPRLQGPAMALSRCYRESQGRLTCVTCHNPHRNASDTSRAEYNRICGSCHQGPAHRQTICPRAPKGDCVSCHMPAQSVRMPTSPVFHTHWIKIWQDTGGAAPKPPR